ncbi:MAG TPA: FAD-dependent oxidoreductase [Euzebyales bacterium]|nr:FAD-dependent oxidoreductase [Euzebyales bacterium]
MVEDLHWADGSTRDLLRFLVRAAGGERLALIATYRTDDIHRAHPLRPYLVELRRDARVRSIDLAPFTRAEFNDHVAAILGTLPRRASLDRLCERSSGNAFFAEELLAASDSGEADPRTGMLQAYMFDTEALEFAAHGRRRVDVVRELFRTLVPGIDGQIIGVAHKAWQEDPWAGGGWGWTQPGQLHWMLPAMRRPEGRVHFAGEHTSLWIAWMNGALESGERVVQEILAAGQRPRAAA